MNTVKSFKNYNFENCNLPSEYYGDYPHVNFFKKAFIPIARKEFKALAKKIDVELVSFEPMYFEYSAFFFKNDKYVYVHIGDVRYNRNWYDDVLYRTAKNEHDYSGGSNRYCSYEELAEKIKGVIYGNAN